MPEKKYEMREASGRPGRDAPLPGRPRSFFFLRMLLCQVNAR
jgi:hypothetical protein